jgi:hypothetical protein
MTTTPLVAGQPDITAAVHAYLTGAGGSAFSGKPVEMLAAWSGDDHLLWRVACRGQEAVVKLFLDAGQARSRRQFDGHTLMHPHDLAPAPLWVDRYPEGLARQLCVYVWCDAAALTPGLRDNRDDGLNAFANGVARLHSAPLTDLRRFSPHPLNLDVHWRIASSGFAQAVAALPDTLPLRATLAAILQAAHSAVSLALPLWRTAQPAPVHGDLRLEHALWDGVRLHLVDWELFGLGDPALDIARFLHRATATLGAGASERWLQRYLDQVDIPDLDVRIAAYRRLLPLDDIAFLIQGLHRYAGDPALAAALPDLTNALSASIAAAAASFAPAISDTGAQVAEYIATLPASAP